MTLAEVAAKIRVTVHTGGHSDNWCDGVLAAVRMFEADPEFKLPDRVEALSAEMKSSAEALSPIEGRRRLEFARRLDEILGVKT